MKLLGASISITLPFKDSASHLLTLTGASLSIQAGTTPAPMRLVGASVGISTPFNEGISKLRLASASLSIQADTKGKSCLPLASLSLVNGSIGFIQVTDLKKGMSMLMIKADR